MRARRLKVGDRIRIIAVPGEGIKNYTIQRETTRVYKMLVRRNRPVRIFWIDEYRQPWYRVRFRLKNGRWQEHWLCVMDDDTNWVTVKSRR